MAVDPGWHPDPHGRHQVRYWDGQAWTAHVGNDGVVTTDEMDTPASATPGAAGPTGSADAELAALQEADERGDAEASVFLGQALRQAGKYDLARAAYERGDARGHPEAAMSLGNMLMDLGDSAGARMAFERGIAAGSTMAALNLGLMLAQAGEADDALHYLGIARDSGDALAHWAIGKVLEGKGDRMGAIDSYKAGADAGDAQAAYALGKVLYDLGDNQGSKTAFQRAAELGHDGAKQLLEMLAREPDGAIALQLVHRLAAECQQCQDLHGACADTSMQFQKAVAVANQPQHPISRDAFLRRAKEYEEQFLVCLGNLRTAQESARSVWDDFLFHSGAEGQRIDQVVGPLAMDGTIDGGEVAAIMIGGLFVKTDFGTTMESFLEADARLAAAMQSGDDG